MKCPTCLHGLHLMTSHVQYDREKITSKRIDQMVTPIEFPDRTKTIRPFMYFLLETRLSKVTYCNADNRILECLYRQRVLFLEKQKLFVSSMLEISSLSLVLYCLTLSILLSLVRCLFAHTFVSFPYHYRINDNTNCFLGRAWRKTRVFVEGRLERIVLQQYGRKHIG